MTDPKQGEREYFARIGAEGLAHARRKPFVPGHASLYLSNFAALLALLPPPPFRVLDFGCGTGWLSLRLAEVGYDVTGIDIAPEAVAAARDDAALRGLSDRATFVLGDYEDIPAAGSFGAVVFYDALHHAESEHAALRAAYAALQPGGVVIAIEPGVGHADAPESRAAVQKFAVHERDMPPGRIIAAGRAAGFVRHLVLPRPYDLNRTVYRPAYHRSTSQADLHGRRFLAFLRFLPRLWRTRDQGLVLLWK